MDENSIKSAAVSDVLRAYGLEKQAFMATAKAVGMNIGARGLRWMAGKNNGQFLQRAAGVGGAMQGAGAGALVGAGIGAATSKEGDRMGGALRGAAMGGAVGGVGRGAYTYNRAGTPGGMKQLAKGLSARPGDPHIGGSNLLQSAKTVGDFARSPEMNSFINTPISQMAQAYRR